MSEGGDVELVFASRWPEGGRGWRGGRKTRLQLGAKGYGRGDWGVVGSPEQRGTACGAHAWRGVFGPGPSLDMNVKHYNIFVCI